jgi:predicted unusual protein kinase regulating ubiquinone biosynthesis (AarF/ABC1/UbiB family)
VIEQGQITSSRAGRIAALAGTGAVLGINYLKHYGRRMVRGESGEEALHLSNAAAVYKTFSELKGGPLKLAQMLSIDKNVLPRAYRDQFAMAQHSVPPLSYPLVVKTFRREFGKDPTELFDTFEQKAAHGASIGQVHRATRCGHSYAVKVQYPGVAKSLRSDLRVIKPLALQMFGLKENDVRDYIQEVEQKLLEETDYTLELKNSEMLVSASSGLENVRFPRYYASLSSAHILSMDWVDGLTLDKYLQTKPKQAERDRIGQALWDFYRHQVHTLRVFHADPHPGNFLVKSGMLWVLDFGCTKAIDDGFYRKQFRFLDLELLENPGTFEKALEGFNLILPSDTEADRRQMVTICAQTLPVLAKPFHADEFDFGDAEFMNSMWKLGQENRDNPFLREVSGRRGLADSLYVNRTYFGLYSLLSLLGAKVKTRGQMACLNESAEEASAELGHASCKLC